MAESQVDDSRGGTYESEVNAPTSIEAWQTYDLRQESNYTDYSNDQVEVTDASESITDIVNKRMLDVNVKSNEDNDVTITVIGDEAAQRLFVPNSSKNPRKSTVMWIVAGVAVFAVAIVGFLIFGKKKKRG